MMYPIIDIDCYDKHHDLIPYAIPKIVQNFSVVGNDHLYSPVGGPDTVMGDCEYYACNFQDMLGMPAVIKGDLHLDFIPNCWRLPYITQIGGHIFINKYEALINEFKNTGRSGALKLRELLEDLGHFDQ